MDRGSRTDLKYLRSLRTTADHRGRRGWREEVWPKGTCLSKTRPGHRAGATRPARWSRYVEHQQVRRAPKGDKKLRFTALLHDIYHRETLRPAYFSLKKEAAAGVDGQTWRHYRKTLEANL